MALSEKTTKLLDEKDEVVREHFVKSLLSLLTGRKYDPTVEQSKLLRTLDKVGKSDGYAELEAMANLTTLLTTKIPDTRDYRAEARELIRAMFPIGEVDGQQDPGAGIGWVELDADWNAAKNAAVSAAVTDPYSEAEAEAERVIGKPEGLGAPYGGKIDEAREVNELVAAIEKDSGSKLSAAEVIEVTKLLRTAIDTEVPQTFKREGRSGGYLIMSSTVSPENAGADLLGLILGLGLASRK